MASLVQQRGLYYAQFYDSAKHPQRKRVPLKTRRKKTARRILGRAEDKYALGEYDPWTDGREHELFGWEPAPEKDLSTLGSAKAAFLASRSHLRESTVRTYREVLRLFVRHLGEAFKTRKLRAKHIQDWIGGKDIADATRRKYVNHVGYLVRYLVEEGWLEEDISKDVDVPKQVETPPKALTRQQQRKLIHAIQAHHQTHAGDGRYGIYPYLLLLVRLNPMMGLRRGELIRLRWDEGPVTVDLEARTVHATSDDDFATKQGRGRVIPLSHTAVELLQHARNEGPSGCPYVYNDSADQLKPSALSHAFCRFRRQAGLPERINLHSTRHAFGTRLAEAGTPIHEIKHLMGHSTTSVTEQYMHASPDQGQHYVDDAFD